MKLITLCLLAVWLIACDNAPPQVDERLLAVLAEQPLIVDVRTPEEFATGHYQALSISPITTSLTAFERYPLPTATPSCSIAEQVIAQDRRSKR